MGRHRGDLLPRLGGALAVASAPEAVRAIVSAEPDAFAPFAADAMAPVLRREGARRHDRPKGGVPVVRCRRRAR